MQPRHEAALVEAAEQHHGVFDRKLVMQLGFSKRARTNAIHLGRWVELHDGVFRFAGSPITWRGELLAACLAGGPRAVASHRSAAALWDLPGADRSVTEIVCPRWLRAVRPALLVHETKALSTADVTVVDGIPVTTVERTLLDLGAVRGPDTVERAVEAALRRDLTSVGKLEHTLRRLARRGRNGAGVLRAIVERRTADRGLTESDKEQMLLQVLRKNGLPEPTLQHEIWHGGRFLGRVDAAYLQWKIAIEYESYEHHTGRAALVRDSSRRNAMIACGWKPIAVTWEDLRTGGSQVCAAILTARRLAS